VTAHAEETDIGALTPLEMARNCARHVLAYADAQAADPLLSYAHRLGERGHQAAELGACMALVSIAEDVHRLTDAAMNGRFGGPPL
jgi:hypothetical protein